MQFWLDEGDPIKQLLDHRVLVFIVLLRDRDQFRVRVLVYGGLDTLGVSCVRCFICLEFLFLLGFVGLNLLVCLRASILEPLCAILTGLLNDLLGLFLGLEKGLNALGLAGHRLRAVHLLFVAFFQTPAVLVQSTPTIHIVPRRRHLCQAV